MVTESGVPASETESGNLALEPETAVSEETDDTPSGPELAADGRININTAGARELETLPGIGPVLAERIVEWRTENGPFRVPEDLMEVSGIGEKKLDGLVELIRVE